MNYPPLSTCNYSRDTLSADAQPAVEPNPISLVRWPGLIRPWVR